MQLSLWKYLTNRMYALQLLQDSGTFLEHLSNWELMLWCLALGLYVLRFMTLGTKINKKYRNFSVLITEQVRSPGCGAVSVCVLTFRLFNAYITFKAVV